MQKHTLNKHLAISIMAGLTSLTISLPASAFLRTKTESKTITATYDLLGVNDAKKVQDIVYKALTHHGDNAVVREGMGLGDVPAVPKRITFKSLNFGPVSVQIPQCEDAIFSVSSNDSSMDKWGDSANYMACGFRYQGGLRVAFYASSTSTSGGVGGLLSGKTLGKVISSAIGLNSDPMAFVEASLTKMEDQFKEAQFSYALIEMAPLMGTREVVADPLAAQQQRANDRAKRLAARAELSKLGVDASDRGRFLKAVQSGDEDLVELFIEAGAIDITASDADGRKPVDRATKPRIKQMLQS